MAALPPPPYSHPSIPHPQIQKLYQARGPWWVPSLKNGVPTQGDLMRSLQQWFRGGIAKDQGVGRACTPLIWPQLLSSIVPFLP